MNKMIAVAKIVNINGVRGALKCVHYCDDVRELTDYGAFYTQDSRRLEVEKISFQKDTAIIKFRGIDSADDGLLYKNALLYIEKAKLPKLDDGIYYIDDLIGLTVINSQNNQTIGRLSDVLKTGANDVYVVESSGDEGKQYLIPAIKDVILSVDLSEGIMKIIPIKGLLNDED